MLLHARVAARRALRAYLIALRNYRANKNPATKAAYEVASAKSQKANKVMKSFNKIERQRIQMRGSFSTMMATKNVLAFLKKAYKKKPNKQLKKSIASFKRTLANLKASYLKSKKAYEKGLDDLERQYPEEKVTLSAEADSELDISAISKERYNFLKI